MLTPAIIGIITSIVIKLQYRISRSGLAMGSFTNLKASARARAPGADGRCGVRWAYRTRLIIWRVTGPITARPLMVLASVLSLFGLIMLVELLVANLGIGWCIPVTMGIKFGSACAR